MNRIEFRAWDSDSEKMLFVEEFPMYHEVDHGLHSGKLSDNEDWVNFDSGTKIYEGDILEEDKGYFFEVVWDDQWAKFGLKHGAKAIQYPDWNRGKQMCIVGNKFENNDFFEKQPE